MALQEEMTPDKMANHARGVFISTAKKILKIKKSKKQIFLSKETLELIEERRIKKNGNLNRNNNNNNENLI